MLIEDIRSAAAEEIRWLNETISQRPNWKWPKELLPLAEEFARLSAEPVVDYLSANAFTVKITDHIRRNRLKGMDELIWRAEAFEEIISKNPR